jgi:hypothetical protein
MLIARVATPCGDRRTWMKVNYWTLQTLPEPARTDRSLIGRELTNVRCMKWSLNTQLAC